MRSRLFSARPRRGFTLAEVVAVVILIAIAAYFLIPQALSSSNNSTDNQAQASVQAAITAQTQWFNQTGALTSSGTNLSKLNADLTYVGSASPSTAATSVSIAANTDGTQFAAAALGSSGCYYGRFTLGTLTAQFGSTSYSFVPFSATAPASACYALAAITNPLGTSTYTGVSSGLFESCALSTSTPVYVYCWGDNSSGQLGNNSLNASATPVKVCAPTGCTSSSNPSASTYLTGATQVSVGSAAACAIVSSQIYCWGANSAGQLGNGTTVASLLPTQVSLPSGETPAQVDVGVPNACARMTDGTVWCWGDNSNGELGNGTTTASTIPVRVSGISTAQSITVSSTSCALLASRTVSCWGFNADGQVGNGSSSTAVTTPATVTGLSNASSVSAGSSSTCATGTVGSTTGLWCWGDNTYGQLGLAATTAYSSTPVQVIGVASASSVSVGNNFACASSTSAIYCWGYNASGQLGTTTLSTSSSPQSVANLPPTGITASSLSAGAATVCVQSPTQQAYCWGDGSYGELGNKQFTSSSSPQQVG